MIELIRRILSGVCFAFAAAVPVAYYFLFNPFNKDGLPIFGGSVLLTVAVPVFVAGICGLLLGAKILDPEEQKSALQAIGYGLEVSLLSYFLMFFWSAVVLILVSEDPVGLLVFCIFLFFYGLLFLGWLVALMGAATGGILYLIRRKMFERNYTNE